MSTIAAIHAREILDSRGNPTVEACVRLSDGSEGIASVPSGASTGSHEAIELRDGDKNRYRGLGVRQAVAHVEGEMREALLGMEGSHQGKIDTVMRDLDGTANKARLGANAILSVSLACCRASARSAQMPLYRYLASLAGIAEPSLRLPMPMFNIINGGKHSNSGLSVQEFKIVPEGIIGYPEQLRAGSEIFHALADILEREQFSTGVGDEGGFAPRVESHRRQLEMISEAIAAAHYERGREIFLDLDVAAQSFYDAEKDEYSLQPEHITLSRENLVNLYREWVHAFDIVSIEDGLHEEDWAGWTMMQERLARETTKAKHPVMLIGDDLLVTNSERLRRAIETRACNAVLIKVNQIGTLSETLDCMRLAREHGFQTIVSHRSGETTDDFIADLAVGAGAGYIKTGSLARGERLVKYNRLLAIDEELKK